MRPLLSLLALCALVLPAATAPLALDPAQVQPIAGDWALSGGEASVPVTAGESAVLLFQAPPMRDFEASCEFQTDKASVGLLLRAHHSEAFAKADAKTHLGAPGVFGLAARAGAAGGVRLLSCDGVEKGVLAKTEDEAPAADAWHTLKVRAEGAKVQVWLNGKPVAAGADEAFIAGRLGLIVSAPKQGGSAKAAIRNVNAEPIDTAGDWRALFNGEDFGGWKIWGEEEWKVEDGVIYGRSGPKKSEGYLATEETFTDFQVRGQFKMLGDGNFGLFYHSTITPREDGYPVIAGVQGEVEPGYPSSTGWLYESYKRGWLIQPPKNTLAAYALAPEEWNEIEIRVAGKVVTTWVNGVRAVHFDDPKPNLHQGSFALQLHTGGVDGIAWKELHVKQ